MTQKIHTNLTSIFFFIFFNHKEAFLEVSCFMRIQSLLERFWLDLFQPKFFSEYLKKKKKLYWYFSIWKIRKNNLKKFYQNIPAKSGNRSKERDYRESYINIFIRMGRNWGFSQRVMRVQYFFSKREENFQCPFYLFSVFSLRKTVACWLEIFLGLLFYHNHKTNSINLWRKT